MNNIDNDVNLFDGEEDVFANFDRPSPQAKPQPKPTPMSQVPYYKTSTYASAQKQKEYAAPVVKTVKKKEKEDTVETHWSNHVNQLSWGVFYEDKHTPIPHAWNGKCWQPMSDEQIFNEAESFLNKYFKHAYSAARAHSCVELTPAILDRLGRILELPKGRSLMSVRGGFLEIMVDGSIKFAPHDKSLFIRNYIDAPIFPNHADADGWYTPQKQEDIEERGGLFGRLITNSFGDIAIRRAFQEHIGDTLLPENSQVTPFLLGSGGQGKSQWVEIMMGMHYNHAVADLSNLRGFALQNFIGCSLLVVDEAEKKIDEQAFKRIFGGGVGVQVDRKFKTPLTWKPDIKGFVALNEMPKFAEHSEAILRRIRPYPMTTAMHGTKTTILDIAKKILNGYKVKGETKGEEVWINDERRDVLDWLLAGAVRVIERGGLMMENELPAQCIMQKDELRYTAEPVWAFIKDMDWQPVDGKGGITKQELYSVYVRWCRETNRGIMSQPNFGKDMKRNMEMEFKAKGFKMKDSKILVKLPNGDGVWKTAFPIVAKGTDYDIKYNAYLWTEEEMHAYEDKVTSGTITVSPDDIQF